MLQSAVAPQELRAVARPRGLPPAHVEERDATPEHAIPRVPGKDGPRVPVEHRHDVMRGRSARGPERPTRVRRDGEPPSPCGSILDAEQRDLDRTVEGHELHELQADPVVLVLEAAEAVAMPRHVRRLRQADR